MRQNLHLYIGDMEVEFNQPPDILYTYQTTELTNPTVIKNSFSKQITIYGSPQNNNIFGQYWNVERLQGTSNGIGAYFNPSKKVPFTLYINGDIYESGYVKLDEVKIVEGKSVEYSITLYGGLGQFFYNLSTDWNTGNKRSLADLNYYEWSEATEPLDLSFTINKETVASAWTGISSNNVYSVINFAPVYAGIPDKIDADKVVMNFNGLSGFSSSVTIDNKTYSISNGYALATLPAKLMAEEVRDYRSYLQTPIVRVKSIIEAICRKENNSGLYDNGYEVELDRDFFNTSNPYYWDSWMTLPSLTNLEFATEGGGVPTAYTKDYTYVGSSQGGSLFVFVLDEPVTGSSKHLSVEFDMAVTANCESDWLEMVSLYNGNAYAVQLYASDSVSSSENVLDASKILWCSHEFMNGSKYSMNDAIRRGVYIPRYNSNSEYISGRWHKVSGTTYLFTTKIKLECDLPVGSTCFKIEIARSNSSDSASEEVRDLYDYSVYNQIRKIRVSMIPFYNPQMLISEGGEGSSYSNRYISKQMILGTDFSPCDFLLSYCKQFGLYIYKDRVEDKIYIKTRKNFYHRDNIIDIQDKVDRLNDITVKPLNIDYGFFALTNSGVSSSFYNDYVNKYGKVYGQKIIATGYDFNADTKNLIDSVFKGAVQAKEMSQYFYTPNEKVHPYMYNSVKYALYEDGDYESGSTDVNAPFKVITEEFEPYDGEFAGYDYISKPMFYDASRKALGTEYTMLFFNGYESIPASYNWNLTDDIGAMYRLNNNPCWLMTTTSADTSGNVIAIPITQFPKFSRWFEGNKWMIYSWDFGSPRELYVPNMTNNDEGNIYWNYFKTYYEDSYDVNSKVVEAYVINKDFTQEDLRNFYWFDNSIWRLNKIEDYNVTSFEGTKCEFVKVQDVNNYTNEDATSNLWIKVTLDKYVLPISGGTLIGTVRTSDNYGWQIEGISISPTGDSAYTVDVSPEYWGSSGNFFITAGTNDGYDKIVTIYVTAGDIGGSVQFIQSGVLGGISVSPTALTFAANGESLTLSVTNPSSNEWEVVGKPNWITASPTSGSATASTITLTASRNDGDERTGSFVIWNKTKNETIVISLSQLAMPYLRLVPSSVFITSEGGVATINVESNVDWRIKISGETSLTGLTIENFAWTSDFPSYAGSYQTKDYSTFNIMAYYDDGTSVDVTNDAIVSGLITLEENTGTTRKTVLAPIAANYQGLDKAVMKTGYQAAYVPPAPVTVNDYLTFEITSGSGYIFWKCTNNNFRKTIEYEINDSGNWYTLTSSTGNVYIEVSAGDKVKVRGNLTGTGYENYYSYFSVYDVNFKLRGNIMSLIDSTGFATATTISSYGSLQHLFENNTGLTDAGDVLIPVTSYATISMQYMFKGCTNLVKAPYIYETASLKSNCCRGMFSGCTSLNYIKCLFNTTYNPGDNSCTGGWVDGVAPTGTFVKHPNMSSWTTGIDGIPTGWTVVNDDYTSYIINNTSTQISGTIVGLGTPDTISIDSGETMGRYDNLPVDITEAYLTGLGLDSGTLTISNGSEYINCVWDSNNNAFMGYGNITLSSTNNTLTITYNS